MDNRLQDRIRKLLALGTSNNQAESAAATAKAQALMDEHNIRAEMLGQTDGETPRDHTGSKALFRSGRRAQWKAELGRRLAFENGGFLYFNRSEVCMVAKPTDMGRIRELFNFCVAEIDRLANLNTRDMGRTYSNNYRLGCITAIGKSIQQEKAFSRMKLKNEAQKQGGNALVVVENAIARVAQKCEESKAVAYRNHPSMGVMRPSWGGARDDGAFNAGIRDGASIYSGAGGAKRLT